MPPPGTKKVILRVVFADDLAYDMTRSGKEGVDEEEKRMKSDDSNERDGNTTSAWVGGYWGGTKILWQQRLGPVLSWWFEQKWQAVQGHGV
jgi:hypothetical protein